MKILLKIVVLSCLVLLQNVSLFADETPQVVRLTPPIINSSTIQKKVVCTRPMREGKFNISTEKYCGKKDSKTIVNIYGHGGSGWTTLFGSVNKGIELFLQQNPDKKVPIRIIGSGCMGLTTAIELSHLGYNVVGIYTKDLYNIPSWHAAGYFALVSVKTSPEEQEALNTIGMNTFLVYQQIDRGLHPYISKEAVRYMPVYCGEDTISGVEDLAEKGLIPNPQNVTLDFGNGVIHPGYVKYMTYFMNTTILMRQLTAEVAKLHIPIDIKDIKSFDDVKEGVVFNCSGLGAKDLNNDSYMIPVRGHLVLLNEAAGIEHMNYMIYSKVMQNGKYENIYMFPKNIAVTTDNIGGSVSMGVLGGTFIPDVDKLPAEEQKAIDQKAFQDMIERNALFFTGSVNVK